MKHITEYIYDVVEEKVINESILSWFKSFFSKIYKTQQTRIENGNVNMYQVDTKKMQVQNDPIPLAEIDRTTLNIWKDNKVGFPISYQISSNPNKFLKDGDKELKPNVYCYFSKDGNNTYAVGILMVDENVVYIDGYRHVLIIEPSLIVDNPTDVNKAIIEQYLDLSKKDNPDIKGLTAKGTIHPKFKGNLLKCGFKQSNSDEEIYVYNI